MKINATSYIYNRKNYQKSTPYISMTQPADVFIKSPSFKGAEYNKIEPFLRDGIQYTSKNLKKFDEIVGSIDFKNRKDSLIESLTETALLFFNKKEETFALDLLLRIGNSKSLAEMCKLNFDAVLKSLAKIKFSDEMKPKVLSLLESIHQHKRDWNVQRFPFFIFKDAIDNENVPLLKTLTQDDNWHLFLYHTMDSPEFKQNQLPIIRQGQKSKNPEIKELFNDKNLYNLLAQYKHIYTTVLDDSDCMFDLGMTYLYNAPERKQKIIAENMAEKILNNSRYCSKTVELLSDIPLTSYELNELYKKKIGRLAQGADKVKEAISLRVKKIIKRNGFDTPKQLLACLNDRVMTPELLDLPYKEYTLIDKIAQIPVREENKAILSQIMEKLSKIKHLPDNDIFRRAGITAAKQGNVELLKFFDSKHVHFANELVEPLTKFPEEVRNILKNAKINDTNILDYSSYIILVKNYLKTHPNIDINSRDKNGNSLISLAIKFKSLDKIKMLAERDDVDWNLVDEEGNTPLMQLLTRSERNDDDSRLKFKKKVLEILRELPKGKLDVNYINPKGFNGNTAPFTALTMPLLYFDTEYDLIDDLLKFPDIDTNLNPAASTPLWLKFIDVFNTFKKLYEHPNTDISLIKAEDIDKVLNDRRIDPRVNQYLKEQTDATFIKWAKNLYENNGMLTLDEIEKFVNYENFRAIKNTQFNVFGENIAHLLTDIFPDIDNPKEFTQIRRIVDKLKDSGFDFQAKDELDRTPLEKAIEGENKIIAEVLRRNS